jgi:signal peptidase I
MFFTPKWKKEAQLLLKEAKKFLNYKRDILKEDRVQEIESRYQDLKIAIKNRDLEKVKEASKQLRATCENSLPHQKPLHWLEENVEVIFVALVVALGLRTYIVQPFRIPTGSMQPTLNGIIATPMLDHEFKKPWLGKQLYDWATRSRQWKQIISPSNGKIFGREDSSFFLFSGTKVIMSDGKSIRFPAPINETEQSISFTKEYKKGDVMFQGTVDGGDLVLVNKFAYHFRKPERGEVFVFNTLGLTKRISESQSSDSRRQIQNSHLAEQTKATHYIKRLCGVPGDTLQIQSSKLFVNGQTATEQTIQHASELPNLMSDSGFGYSYANSNNSSVALKNASDKLTLRASGYAPLREYAALGDNSGSSLDSRYWGAVKQFNVVGPAMFSLWPFTTGHWGLIK